MTNKFISSFCATLFFVWLSCDTVFTQAQISYRYLSGFGTALVDINDSGQAVLSGATYDYTLSLITAKDTDVVQLNGINNNGDLIGMMPKLVSGQTLYQPAYKKNGTWFPIGFFPSSGVDAAATVYQISENGNYVTGQMSPDCCDFQAFLYNVSTNNLERIADPANEYGAGYSVNDSGMVSGWFDPQPSGTLRVPAIMTTGSVVNEVPPGMLPTAGGEAPAISNSNLVVGDFDQVPFMYNINTNTFNTFSVPGNYQSATFTSVSENGVAVGYAQTFGAGGLTRDAIIYHPLLGAQPVFIRDILAANNLYVPTFDSLLGTAIAISPDGNYVCGWENGPFFFATGWAIDFGDSLLPTGINEVAKNECQVYPNPAKDFVNIAMHENITTVKVYNAMLQQQASYFVNAQKTKVDLSNLPAGIYFLEINTAHATKVVKVMRQ